MRTSQDSAGFTLLELSIVLVIIGLIVGGILTGRDLIDSATIRAQLTQIERYNTAVRTFQGKYGYIPGDIPEPYASSFGFQARGSNAGQGDGNGTLEGNCPNSAGNNGGMAYCGELAVFWQDLSRAQLIEIGIGSGANYPNTVTPPSPDVTWSTTPAVSNWLPQAKLGKGNYVYLYSLQKPGINYFVVSTVTDIGWTITSSMQPGVTVLQAYNIDKKIDDGYPQTGSVRPCYINQSIVNWTTIWAAGGGQGASGGNSGLAHDTDNCTASTAATAYATTNCFDNNGSAGATQTYSIAKNAAFMNCALSFQFQ